MIKTIFDPFPHLSTERFNLRQLKLKDDKEIFALRSDERVIKYLGRPPVTTIGEAHEFIKKVSNGISKDESIYWVITKKNVDKLIGTICLWNLKRDKAKGEIGFELLPDYMGMGVIQEVIPVIIDFGYDKMKLKIIEGEVEPSNIKSVKLMERFGFSFKRKLKNTVIYSIINDD